MNRRKKILYIITKSSWGGAQKYVYDLASRLPPDKFDIAVACGPSTGSGQAAPLAERLKTAGIRVVPIRGLERDINLWKEIVSFWSLLKIFIREKPDIIHLNSSKAGGLGAVAAKLASLVISHRPLAIFTVHGWGFNEDRPRWQRGVIFFFSWLAALFQDRIILIDEADYRTAEKFIPRRKLALIHHGIAPIGFLSREEARAFLAKKIGRQISAETQIIGTIAELTRNKGLTYAIDAVNRLKSQLPIANYQLLIIGDGEDRGKLQKQINSLGLQDSVFLLGFVPEAHRYLKGFDMFVLSSVKEGLPYVLIEAMSAGLPIAATNAGGVPDLIENEKNGLLVPPKDPAALASAIAELLINRPERRRALSDSARRKVENEFNMDAMLSKTIARYSTVISHWSLVISH